MRKITILFWVLVIGFVYKTSFLDSESSLTDHRFSIYRDNVGVPHVYSKSKKDLMFGYGYAQAQDRLWTLHIKKFVCSGRLAEMLGPEALELDYETRNINYLNVAKKQLENVDPETLELAQAYADGINEYARNCKILPFEFYLLWTTWEDWKVEDTLATLYYLSFTLEFDWIYEIARQRMYETLGLDLAIKILSFGEENLFRKTYIMNQEEVRSRGQYKWYNSTKQRQIISEHWASKNMSLGSINFPKNKIEGQGSNAWVIGGEHTFHGKPILASDPHLASLAPPLFYMIELVLLNEDNTTKTQTFGLTADGVPSITIGVAKKFAWGSTAAYIDNKDMYYETTRHNEGKFQYLYLDKWEDFIERNQTFLVRGSDPITETFHHTHRGVVLQSLFMKMHWKYGFPLHDSFTQNHTLTLAAGIYRPDKTTLKGMISLSFVETQQDFTQAGVDLLFPNIDSVFILQNGSYGYAAVGGIPKRQIPEMGSFLKDGNKDIYDMRQNLNITEKPTLWNPKKGYISMANNKFAPDSYEYRSSLHEIVTGRSYRIQKMITNKIEKSEKFTFDDMIAMQLDYKDEFLSEVFPKVLGKLTEMREIWSNSETEEYFRRLLNWDYILSKDSVEASFYQVWQHLFDTSLFETTDLNEEEKQSLVNHAFFENFRFVLFEKISNGSISQNENIVCINKEITLNYSSTNQHPCAIALALAFKRLPAELKMLFSSEEVNDYKWGAIHYEQFKSVPFSDIPVLKEIWGREIPVGGNSRTPNVAIITHQSKSYKSVGDAVGRLITDLDTTYFSFDLGNTDRLSSQFYDNFMGKDMYVQYTRENPFINGPVANWTLSIDTMK